MAKQEWIDVGDAAELAKRELQQVMLKRTRIALTCRNGSFSAISGICNHVGGPLGEGWLDGDYVTYPWHFWKFHHRDGKGEPGFEADAVPAYAVKVENGRVLIDAASATPRTRKPHDPHPLARPIERKPGPIRVIGISTTVMHPDHPRYSTSDALLKTAVDHAKSMGCNGDIIYLRDLNFRHCEGYYSKSAHACTWPCSITQMDANDQMDQVYEAFVHWADAIIVASPIRWGAASSLYFKMAERLNCVQNSITISNRILIRNKVAGFIIVGGQDNIQGVAGQMLGFFAEVGCQFPQFPYITHSRGWSAEDMENNTRYVETSKALHEGARALAERAVEMAKLLVAGTIAEVEMVGGGRKGHHLDVKAQT